MATPISIIAKLIDITATGLPFATATLELTNDPSAIPRVPSTAIVAGPRITFEANASGVISGTVWGNDSLTPAGTYYVLSVTDQTGLVQRDCAFTLTGTDTINLSTLTCA